MFTRVQNVMPRRLLIERGLFSLWSIFGAVILFVGYTQLHSLAFQRSTTGYNCGPGGGDVIVTQHMRLLLSGITLALAIYLVLGSIFLAKGVVVGRKKKFWELWLTRTTIPLLLAWGGPLTLLISSRPTVGLQGLSFLFLAAVILFLTLLVSISSLVVHQIRKRNKNLQETKESNASENTEEQTSRFSWAYYFGVLLPCLAIPYILAIASSPIVNYDCS